MIFSSFCIDKLWRVNKYWYFICLHHHDGGTKGRGVISIQNTVIVFLLCPILFICCKSTTISWDTNSILFIFFSDKRPEQSIASARASVMIYDDLNKKWVPSGSSHGLSKVHIYHHFLNNTFRVVGRKLQDHEVSKKNSKLPTMNNGKYHIIFWTAINHSCFKFRWS